MEKAQVYALIETHFREKNNIIVKKIAGHMGNMFNAEDVVQETYYRACKYWKTFNEELSFNTWFGTLLNNAVKDYFKAEMGRGMSGDDPPDLNYPTRMFQRIEIGEMMKRIEAEEPRISRILKLYIIEELRSKEVAEIVPESAANIRKIVQRFRDGL